MQVNTGGNGAAPVQPARQRATNSGSGWRLKTFAVLTALLIGAIGLLWSLTAEGPCDRAYPPSGEVSEAIPRLPQYQKLVQLADRVRGEGAQKQVWLLDHQEAWGSCHLYLLNWDGASARASVFYSTSCRQPDRHYDIWQIEAAAFAELWNQGRTRAAELPAQLSLQHPQGTLYYAAFSDGEERSELAVHSAYICPDHPDFASYRELLSRIRNTAEPRAVL